MPSCAERMYIASKKKKAREIVGGSLSGGNEKIPLLSKGAVELRRGVVARDFGPRKGMGGGDSPGGSASNT